MKISRSSILLLLLSTTTTTTLAQQDEEFPCFSLQNSTACSAYKEFYISLVGNVRRYPFLANVTDIESFDAAMNNYVLSPSFYLIQLGCTNKASPTTTIPYARYSLTYLCSSIIQDNLYSLPCNYGYNLSPPPLCQSTCYDWTASVKSITDNIDMCPNQVEQSNALDYINSTCQTWSGLNGTTNCIVGMANEPDNCGFHEKERACTYCKSNNSNDPCCQKVQCTSSLSVGAIIGIIIGCLVAAALIGAIFYFFCYRKKRSKNGVSYSNNGFIMKTKLETQHHDSTSALGYESLASQGALVPHPPIDHNSYMNQKPHHLSIRSKNLGQPQPQPQQQAQLQDFSTGQTLEEFYEVKHPYPPQMGDELGLHVGDIVCVAMNFDDGWALGFNVTTGLKGVFPVVCVTPAPEELLEQLLYEQPTNKTLVEDNGSFNMQQICENIRRSMSASSKRTINTQMTLPTSEMTQHSNIPRRTASMMRHTNTMYDYRESDSPTSPTLHTPFFDASMLHHNNSNNNTNSNTSLPQPEPALFQPIETYEMHRKNNRVSKLEE